MTDSVAKELTITFVDGPNEKGWITAKTADGTKYGSKNAKLLNYQGVTAVFHTNTVQNGKYKSNYINDPLPEIPASKASSNPMLASKESNTALMVAKDLVVARMTSGMMKDVSNTELSRDVLDIYDQIMSGMSAKKEEDQVPF